MVGKDPVRSDEVVLPLAEVNHSIFLRKRNPAKWKLVRRKIARQMHESR
jgi:hypothetical protein